MREFIRQKLYENLDGNGYVAYHGSETKINNFVDDFVGGRDAVDQEGPGIYFTSSKQNAMYYGKYIYTVRLSPKNIISVTDGENVSRKQLDWLIRKAPDWEETAQNWNEHPKIGLKIAIDSILKYRNNPHQQFQQVWFDFYRNNPVDYVRNIVKLGYDAIVIDGLASMVTQEKDIKHTIVLNPSIIKFIKLENDEI